MSSTSFLGVARFFPRPLRPLGVAVLAAAALSVAHGAAGVRASSNPPPANTMSISGVVLSNAAQARTLQPYVGAASCTGTSVTLPAGSYRYSVDITTACGSSGQAVTFTVNGQQASLVTSTGAMCLRFAPGSAAAFPTTITPGGMQDTRCGFSIAAGVPTTAPSGGKTALATGQTTVAGGLSSSSQPSICISNCTSGGGTSSPSTLVLQPTKTVTTLADGGDHYSSDVWCAGQFHPALPVAPPDLSAIGGQSELAYGYEHYYDPGTNPLPCWASHDWYMRGGVGFDMDAATQFLNAHGIASAVLQWSVVDGQPGCTLTVYVSSDTWESQTPGAYPYTNSNSPMLALGSSITPGPQGSGTSWSLAVGDVLKLSDLLGGRISPHLHFVFKGGDETFNHDNNTCWQVAGQLTLTLTGSH